MTRTKLTWLFSLMALTLNAQYNSGIEATIVDQSGSAISDARVTITNQATHVVREVTANASGYFRVSDLAPGPYRVEVQSPGFEKYVQTSLQITANQLTTIYPKLAVGEQKVAVEVTANVETIETGKSSVASVVSQKTIENAPMLGRNIYGGVSFIAPGVTGSGVLFGGGASGNAGQDSFQTQPGFQINSAGQRQETNEYQVDGSSVNGNSRDGIANLTPQPDTVQEVRVAAAAFTAERGRNSGALIEVYTKSGTNQIHGTLSEFHTNNQLTSRTVFQSAIPAFRRNEFGGVIGGPAIKDRTFLFGSYYRLSSSASQTDVVTAETQQFVDYLKSFYPNNVSTRILTSAPIGAYPTRGFVTAGSLASSARFPVPATLSAALPVLGTSVINETVTRPAHQWNTRLDQYFGQKDRVFFNYFNTLSKAQSANPRPAQRIIQANYGMYGKADWTHTISPNLLNEASMTLVRVDGATPPSTDPSLPSVTVTGMQSFSQSQIGWVHANYNWNDLVTYMHGNHSFRLGASVDRQHDLDNFTPSYARPTFTFGNVLDFAQDMPLTQSGPVIDTRTGLLAQNVYTKIHMTYIGAFIQDDWKVRKNLTLNLGVRYEYFGHLAQIDQGGTPSRFFAPGSGSTFNEQITNGKMRTTGGGLVTTNTPQGWMPRIGFGWDVFSDGSLAMRGGYGIYLNRIGDLSYVVSTNPPFGSVALDIRNGQKLNFALGTPNGLSFPLPPGLQFQLNPAGGLVGTPISVKGLSPVIDPPTVQIWNLSIAKRLTNSLVLQVDYLANHSDNLFLQTNVNRYSGDLLQHNGTLTRLNPNFGPITYGRSAGYSDAHYGSILLGKRFSKGFSAKGIYTFGKATDLTSSNDNGVAGGQNVRDAANYISQHAVSDFDVSRRLTLDSVYEIPSLFKEGLGSRILGGWNLAGIAIFQSGLPYSVITTSAYPKGDFNADGFNYDSPNTPTFGNHVSVSRSDYINGLFAASAFPIPAPGQEGNLGRNTFTGPGLANVNLNIMKTAHIPWFVKEGATVQLRGEIFNILNRVNLGIPVNDLSNALFGKSTTQSLPRSVTVGVRIQY
ncbi:MAG: TonB-dependent receptor [Acidobacteriota bacterium]|nr:TonB-dependent receptor [Acidobacteriota bacterium]